MRCLFAGLLLLAGCGGSLDPEQAAVIRYLNSHSLHPNTVTVIAWDGSLPLLGASVDVSGNDEWTDAASLVRSAEKSVAIQIRYRAKNAFKQTMLHDAVFIVDQQGLDQQGPVSVVVLAVPHQRFKPAP